MSPRRLVFLTLVINSVAALAAEPQTLTLSQAVDELNAKNLTLAQSKARADELQGIVRQSLSAMLPTLAAGGSYTRNNAEAKLALSALLDSIEGGLNKISPVAVKLDRSNVPSDAVIQPLEAFTGQAALRVPIFAANGYADYFAAKASQRAAELSVESARQTLQAVLEQSAVWGQAAEEIAGASERALVVAEEHEKSTGREVSAGTVAPLTLLQARTETVRRQSEVVRTRAEKERAWLATGVLLGRAEPVRVTVPNVRETSGELAQQLDRAIQDRPELKAQAANLEAAKYQVDSAWWRLAPTLSASAAANVSNVVFVTGQNTAWRVSVDLAWTLYDGGFRYGKKRQAEAQLRGAELAREAQEIQVRQEVLDSRRDVEVAAERLTLAQKQAALAQETAASARRSFAAGLATSLDVLDANDREYQAQVALADARAQVSRAGVSLAKAVGSLVAR